MPALRDLQEEFAAAVLGTGPVRADWGVIEDGIAAADRIAIHAHTARAVMTQALRLTFPAVDALVGAAFFDMAAARFARAAPPRSGCLDDFGEGFPEFLARLPEAVGVPYLADVGRFEWALSVAAHAPDVPPLTLAALAAMAVGAPERLVLSPHASVGLLHLLAPADRIADAVLSGDDAAMAAIDLSDSPVRLLVWRGADGLAARRLSPPHHRFLADLFGGAPLGVVLAYPPDPTGTFQPAAALAAAFADGLVGDTGLAVP